MQLLFPLSFESLDLSLQRLALGIQPGLCRRLLRLCILESRARLLCALNKCQVLCFEAVQNVQKLFRVLNGLVSVCTY